jgi:hypothetical protein
LVGTLKDLLLVCNYFRDHLKFELYKSFTFFKSGRQKKPFGTHVGQHAINLLVAIVSYRIQLISIAFEKIIFLNVVKEEKYKWIQEDSLGGCCICPV